MSAAGARAARALAAIVVTLAAGGCGDDGPAPDYAARVHRACPGASTGAQGLQALRAGSPDEAVAIVKRAERTATRAARRLIDTTPPKRLAGAHEEAERALLSQAHRLRLVRDQIDRGSAPRTVVAAARAGLEAGDRQAAQRLAAIGAGC
ncbi:MAG: hypothetical protein IRZ32_12755 [Solirubrobacteraceae bacterium]|nr:hypothetical protein [Solirubrobacteraceae bacterium]